MLESPPTYPAFHEYPTKMLPQTTKHKQKQALLNSSMNDDFLASRKGAKAQSFVAYFYQKF
jgi:hypothetical protein